MSSFLRKALHLLPAAVFAAYSGFAVSQGYPSKPVRIVVPFGPGGSTDIVGRYVAQKLGDAFGQAFIVENRPGVGGNLGANLVAKSPPDGYNLLLVTVAYAINPSVYTKMPFDPSTDLIPVGLIASAPNVLVVNPSLPVSTVADLISLAKQKPLFYASAGNGTQTHLAAALFNAMAGIKMTHVPYKSISTGYTDLFAGQVQVAFPGIVAVIGYVKSGRMKALAVTGPTRSKVAPDIPTIAESGFPAYEAVNWYALLAPGSTPKAIVEKLNSQLNTILLQPDTVAILARDGAEPLRSTTAESQAYISKEIAKWEKVSVQAGVTEN